MNKDIGIVLLTMFVIIAVLTGTIVFFTVNTDEETDIILKCPECGNLTVSAFGGEYYYNDGSECIGSEKECQKYADYTYAKCGKCNAVYKVYRTQWEKN